MNNKLSAAARREENWGWFMVAPTIIGLVVLNLWPFVQTLYASFCEHEGFGHYKFIGLQNYVDMFTNAEFWKATWNTIYFSRFMRQTALTAQEKFSSFFPLRCRWFPRLCFLY